MFVNQPLEGLNLHPKIFTLPLRLWVKCSQTQNKKITRNTHLLNCFVCRVRAMWQMLTGHTVTYLHKQTNYDN